MKQKEIIEKLKQGHYIQWSEINYTRRIFIYTPDGKNWLDQINIKSFEALKEKGVLKVETYVIGSAYVFKKANKIHL